MKVASANVDTVVQTQFQKHLWTMSQKELSINIV